MRKFYEKVFEKVFDIQIGIIPSMERSMIPIRGEG